MHQEGSVNSRSKSSDVDPLFKFEGGGVQS